MYSNSLLKELTQLANLYGKSTIYKSEGVVVFKELSDNFHMESWDNINKPNNKEWLNRTKKVHSHFKNSNPPVLEMQSSNSSDALAMNIFCHPKIGVWKGVLNLLNVQSLQNIDFGFKAKVIKKVDDKIIEDNTEIDFHIENEIIGECKLTESNFTSKDKVVVHQYAKFQEVFHINKLSQSDKEYHNYQLIRNILAAEQHACRFVLFCDMRRPDLVKYFIETVNCIKDEHLGLRQSCRIIYWQDIAHVSHKDLKEFLKNKYGIK